MMELLGEHRNGSFGRPERAGLALGAIVAAAFGLRPDDLGSARRGAADVAFARQVAMYLAHTHFRLPLTTAGELFHRDRTTARHACKQVEERRDDPRVDALLAHLERSLDLAADIARLRSRTVSDA